MINNIKPIILLGRGKCGIHTILKVPRSSNQKGLDYPHEGLLMVNPLVDMESFVLMKDNMLIYNSKSHKLNCGYSIHLME